MRTPPPIIGSVLLPALLVWGCAIGTSSGGQSDAAPAPIDGTVDAGSGGGGCAGSCVVGSQRCLDRQSAQVCRMSGACTAWALLETCEGEARCDEGACVVGCFDACDLGQQACVDGSVATCGQFDDDPCLEYGDLLACPQGQRCEAGSCLQDQPVGGADGGGGAGGGGDVCRPECDPGARRCGPTGDAESCVPGATGCAEWTVATLCRDDQTCEDGGCVALCRDLCASGAARCADPETPEACLDADGDGCLEWVEEALCPLNASCEAGTCVERPPPAVHIQEVLHDAEGRDGTGAFVELGGPAGERLEGVVAEAVNGRDGSVYDRLVLEGTLGADGLFVIAHPDAAPALAAEADVRDGFGDLQNGPDSVRLVFGEQILDALAYGEFGPEEVAAGEGAPAPDVAVGESLSRDAQGTDTDDNATDFVAAPPTPGRW